MSLQPQPLGLLWCPCHNRATASRCRHSLQSNQPCFRSCRSLTGRRGACGVQARQLAVSGDAGLLYHSSGSVVQVRRHGCWPASSLALQQRQAPRPMPGREHQQFPPLQLPCSLLHHTMYHPLAVPFRLASMPAEGKGADCLRCARRSWTCTRASSSGCCAATWTPSAGCATTRACRRAPPRQALRRARPGVACFICNGSTDKRGPTSHIRHHIQCSPRSLTDCRVIVGVLQQPV